MRLFLFLGLIFLMTAKVCVSQEIKKDTLSNNKTQPTDTTFIKSDEEVIEIESYSKRFDPRKALLFSAVFPGAGQFYNKKYWKMPIVYGGFGFLIYVANFYHQENLKYRDELFGLINDSSSGGLSPSGLNEDQLRNVVDQSRRERDFFIILNGLWYVLQMVDAQVDAHLKEFDINPKMQVRIEPMIDNSAMTGRNSGIALRIRF
jgi:Family of unknown function (DUF5683)